MLSNEKSSKTITLFQCSNKNTHDAGGQKCVQQLPNAMHYLQGNNPNWALQMSVGILMHSHALLIYTFDVRPNRFLR